MKRIAAGTFKARCLRVITEVHATGEHVVITKRGAPVVQVAPIASGKRDVFGFMAGEFKILGDIESPLVPEKRRTSEAAKGKTQLNRCLWHPGVMSQAHQTEYENKDPDVKPTSGAPAHRVESNWEVAILDKADGPIQVVWSDKQGEYKSVYEKKIRATRPVIIFCGYSSWAVLYAWTNNRVAKIWLRD